MMYCIINIKCLHFQFGGKNGFFIFLRSKVDSFFLKNEFSWYALICFILKDNTVGYRKLK